MGGGGVIQVWVLGAGVPANTLNKPLAATRIYVYLSRDPVEMKRIGDELGTSEAWEKKKFDIMYICLKMKFDFLAFLTCKFHT